MEFKEFSDPLEEDYDINEDFYNDEESTSLLQNNSQDVRMELIELIGLLEDDEFNNIEELYVITQYEYMHPTKEVIEKVKTHLKNTYGRSR